MVSNQTSELLEKAKVVAETLKEEKKNIEPEYVGRECPNDGGQLVYKYARKGHSKFIGCINYPKCTYLESLKEKPKILDEACPKCSASLLERKNKRGQPFIGCSAFPKCDYLRSLKSNPTTVVPAEAQAAEALAQEATAKKRTTKRSSKSAKKTDE